MNWENFSWLSVLFHHGFVKKKKKAYICEEKNKQNIRREIKRWDVNNQIK